MSPRLVALLGVPLTLVTLWAVYQKDIGQDVLWVSGPLALLLIWRISSFDDRGFAEEMEAWRKSAGKRKPRVVSESYRNPAVVRKTDRRDLARDKLGADAVGNPKKVVAPPWELSSMVELAGGGRVVGVYQLLPKLAYVIASEADAMATSDFVAVVARLEAKHPELLARPRTPDDKPTARTVTLKDVAFGEAMWVEAADAKAARELLSEGVREVLLELEKGWLFVRGDAMALVRYGSVEASDVHALVDAADAIFAEIGAAGGPSLLDDEDVPEAVDAPAPKKKAAAAKVARA